MSLFCRHNRFVAECPICSRGTVLDPNRKQERRPRPSARPGSRSSPKGRVQAAGATRVSSGPFASAGPYDDGREVRLEKVPGGLRLAAWHAGVLETVGGRGVLPCRTDPAKWDAVMLIDETARPEPETSPLVSATVGSDS